MSSFLATHRRAKMAIFCLFLAFVGLWASLGGVQAVASEKNSSIQEYTANAEVEGATETTESVVLFGFAGVRWDDINETDTPNLFAFTHNAAGANLVVKTFGETTCPMRGWLTLGSGVRMSGPCASAVIDADGNVENWNSYVSANKKNQYKPSIGLLGTSLAKSVGSEKILVLGSGAGLALADSKGKVVGEYIDTIRVGDTSESNMSRVSVAEALGHGDATAQLIFIDLGQVRYGSSSGGEETREGINSVKAAFTSQDTALPAAARADLVAIDQNFGQALKQVENDIPQARILVTSLADSQSSRAELSFFAAHGLSPDKTSSLVLSDATRNEGFVQNTDVTATLISWFGLSSQQSRVAGSPIFVGASTDSLASTLAGEQDRARLSRGLVGFFYFFFAGLTVFVAYMTWRALRRKPKREQGEEKSQNYLAFIALVVASLPVSSLLVNLVPWWNLTYPYLVFVVIMGCIALLIATAAFVPLMRGKPHFSMAIIGFVTAGVVMIDVIAGSITYSCLQFPSVFGAPAQVGGRFYGLSNATFAIFAIGLLIGLAVFARLLVVRGKSVFALMLIIVCGLIALSVDGLAVLGADFGGPPALTLGLALLIFMVRGKKITVPRAAIILVLAACTSLVFSLIDYAKPVSERSHLGRFIQSVVDGNLLSVLSRKISAAAFGLPTPIALALIVLCVVLLVWAWKKWIAGRGSWQEILGRLVPSFSAGLTQNDGDTQGERVAAGIDVSIGLSAIRYSLPAVLLTLIGAAFINDSSITIPLVGGAVALMLYCAVLLQVRREGRSA